MNKMKKIITILSVVGVFISCVYADEQNTVILSKYVNKTYQEMLEELGAPVDKTGYTIEHAPTKGWNHSELFSKYPKTEENKNIQIMEVTWSTENEMTLACFHTVDGTNRCLVAKRMKKEIRH